jgi:hypothetical protein
MTFFLHELLMALAVLCLIIGVSTAVFLRQKRNWLKIHKTFNSIGFIGMFIGVVMAFTYVSESGGNHLDGIHQIVGIIVFVLTLVTLILGFYQFKVKDKMIMRVIHYWMGRFALFLVVTNLILGLMLAKII